MIECHRSDAQRMLWGDLNEAAKEEALMFAEYFLSLQVRTVWNVNEEPFQLDIVINV